MDRDNNKIISVSTCIKYNVVRCESLLMTIVGAIAQYTWNCSTPDEHGVRYIPEVSRDSIYGNNVVISTTRGDVVNVYQVQPLNADCYGEVITIEYCYQYDTNDATGEAVFNWTVLIFEETNETVLTIREVYVLVSSPSSLSEGVCVDIGGGTANCCDREMIQGFDVRGNFIFGVTESAQGNTAGATLLDFFSSGNIQPEYRVSWLRSSKDGQSLAVGSTLIGGDDVGLGSLRMIWFAVGKLTLYAHMIIIALCEHISYGSMALCTSLAVYPFEQMNPPHSLIYL